MRVKVRTRGKRAANAADLRPRFFQKRSKTTVTEPGEFLGAPGHRLKATELADVHPSFCRMRLRPHHEASSTYGARLWLLSPAHVKA